ncbi:MAG: hypothetical protein GPJ52_10425 [Candidatus Heimdallarchaeota archaeon]|nr:hypothetical protein [Candidatus Heimdallarchaeota archaeon]
MSRKKETIRVSLLLVIILSGFVIIKPVKIESKTKPFFTLKAITNGGGIRPDLLFFLKQHCARIGIDIQVYTFDWGTLVGMLLGDIDNYNFDIFCVGLVGFAGDPDWSKVYGENATLNMGGYHTSMDWEEELGTGRNEWYLQKGIDLMPPESEERVHHYWEWQDYLMDKILPMQPLFNPKSMMATWSNLQGFDYAEGILPSWGRMSFTGLHTGQNNQDELIINGKDYDTINPLRDKCNYDISNLILVRAIWWDSQLNVHPHLATDVSLINDTHIRISIREGVKWNSDPDGFFTNEYLDVDDFYFTYYAFKHLYHDKQLYKWIKDIVKVDQYTLDIHIDRDPSTIENDNFAPFQKYLEVAILPEHYLNQSQLPDGQSPDTADSSWGKFDSDGFGTGLFEFDSHEEGVQTTLSVVNDCWYLDPLVDKSDMDFINRFGDFTGGLNKLRIRVLPARIAQLAEFEIGKIDMVPITSYYDLRDEFLQDPNFEVHSRFSANLLYFGYNMRENRDPIGSREPCADNPTITKGLAVRKAISYALDVEEINNVLFGGEYLITHYPFYETLAKWKNPNIVRYEHNLDTARRFMALAGYTDDTLEPERLNPWEISGKVLISVFIAGVIVFTFFKTKKK